MAVLDTTKRDIVVTLPVKQTYYRFGRLVTHEQPVVLHIKHYAPSVWFTVHNGIVYEQPSLDALLACVA